MLRWSFTALILILSLPVNAATLKKVRIDFVEALAPRDTTSSERFQKDYEGAIALAKTILSKKLTKCGYEFETKTAFYEASDNLKAKEFAEALGVEENRYRHWERGSAQPDLAMLTRITRLLKIEPNDLFPLAYRRKDQGNPGGSALAS